MDTREFELISLNAYVRIFNYVISFFVFLFNIVSFACFFALNISVNLGLLRSLKKNFFFGIRFSTLEKPNRWDIFSKVSMT